MSNQDFFNTSDSLFPAKLTYLLFALGLVLGGIPTLAGLIYAYIARGKDPVADSHLTHLIRTFWISFGIAIVAVLTAIIGIGFILMLALAVWFLVRLITGFILLNNRQPVSSTQYLGAYTL